MTLPYDDSEALEAACMPFLKGEKQPATAEELMAARYVAYTVVNIDYILETQDPGSREQTDREATEQWAKGSEWKGLEIVETVAGGPDDDEGIVEFIAKFAINGRDTQHHERSTFKRIDGNWHFVRGKQVSKPPVKRAEPKVGRNDPCSCGSGKKFKKCCANK